MRSAVESSANERGGAGLVATVSVCALALRRALLGLRCRLACDLRCDFAAAARRATRFMPQREHVPGLDEVTSACMGQT